jgi:ABC-2 type transport system ATP-binding protein
MIIEADGLAKQFGSHRALRGLELRVPEGSAFALIGANGAGKSTAIKILLNMLEPTSGSARVLGVDSRALRAPHFARIGYVSENQVLPHRMSVGAYISYLRPFYPTWDMQLESEVLKRMRLPMDRRIGDLSHGMRMKMALACALPFRPSVLILDEPFSGLDPLMRDDLLETLIERADDLTVLISSHELTEIEGFVSHVAFLDEGSLLFQESIDQLQDRLRDVSVTMERSQGIPQNLPPEWLQVRLVGNVLHFVDTAYTEEAFERRLYAAIKGVRDVSLRPMPLRQTFTMLARSCQQQREAA